ncbi:PKD domain-containing protein [Salinimicrobium sp. GXAS 041]|uniref:PKD domain-containing protein n=1 Tax=Salinimicrobium sp. GXAS 041 TaxID=3400806 RepID=UPI003C783710
MKNIFRIMIAVFISTAIVSCDKDDDSLGVDLEGLAAPSNLGANFQITQDNSGLVTVIPTGEGANLYQIDFGDGSPVSTEIKVGEQIEHVYAEGEYEVTVTGKNIAGKTAQGIQSLTVSFLPPENLEATITRDPDDNYTISVSATADYAAMYEVYFGEGDDEEATPLMAGETVSYTYSNVGTYNVRVVALSGGAATTEITEEIVISDPLFLPITFESPTLNYTFINFGGGDDAGAPIVENPDPSGLNTSAMVASYTKPEASETWAGTQIVLDEPIDFSSTQFVSVDIWSPIAGADVILKVENRDNADIAAEFTATTTVSEEWETLHFDLSSIDPSQEYGRIVLFFNFNVPGTGETYYFDNIQTTQLEFTELPLTFESENLTYTWGGFGGTAGGVVANPDPSGINPSANVIELNESSGAETWAGMSLNLDQPLDFSDGTTVKMKVWSPEAGVPVLLKFENSASVPEGGGNPTIFVEVIQNTTTSQEWEELSFNLSSFEAFDPAVNYDRVIIFYDFGNPGEGTTSYYDDIRIGDTDYISLFSDVEENVVVDSWRTNWSISDYEEVTFDGRLAKRYYNLNYVGIETISNPIDASEMTYFHTDFYTEDATSFRVKLVDLGPDGVYGGGDDTEHEVAIENPAQNEWVSLQIPLNQFENLAERAQIGQLIYSASPSGAANMYVTNVYFHK